jgi:flagellin-like hook-associated protein FlgL
MPFTASGGTLTYNGDLGTTRVEAAPGQTMDLSLSGTQTYFTTAFDTLTSTITALQNNDTATLSNASLTNIQASLSQSSLYRGEIGNRVRTVTDYQSDQTRRIEELTKGVSDVTDVDLAQAITDYQSAQTAYQAALQMAGQGNKLSLMDFIRG